MMRALTLAELAQMLGVRAPAANGSVRDICTDTRALQSGDLFVALRGERFDGHGFLETAREAGAIAAVVDTPNESVALPQLVVPDTIQALADLARYNRNLSDARVVAVTGSSGKTTFKEMLSAILSREGETLATLGNLNNHIGAPLTLFRLAPKHRFAVIELGASGLGEIAHTVAAARPEVAVITNAGEAHLEGFGSYENIVQAKGEIIDGVIEGGTVVLNRDDPAFGTWQQRAGNRRVVSVSARGDDANYRCAGYELNDGAYSIRVVTPQGSERSLTLNMPGEHNICNALLAMAAAEAVGAGWSSVVAGLGAVRAAAGRLERKTLSDRVTVIDDSYNANPTSMKAALDVLSREASIHVAVLGGMAELGAEGNRLHREVGEHARALGIDRVLVVGTSDGCGAMVSGFPEQARRFDTHQQAVEWLLANVTGPMTILVKGSRSSAMDQVVRMLQEKVNNPCCSG
ncbi:UDP-N-acetylmuramoyl-tripeptide--D-alanyl-D-alanine ligase [Marinobacter zhanjiangensis]|uniref:UDP-N-acetylmuramoyl-tripeptide--D-alanyl-D-alanine ligase n=1 Tax=Marinobacter zhanjiangensis TaxID=578215 RepID=A0ABQ3AUH8_9GAMM|nr:UDP-N-acetylmuramoyl-tripeptide--D-alanyl-D-alanine ligase [Marinobacter zhanjiangensis]GGY68170.1 UDP-N-acetylmuramoyl-tripeptide--D-alanyl-D-alanine ligase [Marinobacter zhanjiangensis]